MVTSEISTELFGPVNRPRRVEHVSYGEQTTDGAGVKLRRVIDKDLHRRLDPFLMLDAFRSNWPDDFIAGFPDHPHRGFEAVTYLLSGRMRHRDSAGNEGVIEGGGVQWMSAGRGVVHSEMPEQENGAMEGFQLWLNLPARDKMGAPWYLEVQRGEVPVLVTATGTTVRVIAGSSYGVTGAVQRPVTEPLLLDVVLPSQCRLEQPLSPEFNAFVYVYRGTVAIDDRLVEEGQLAILNNDADSDGICLVGENAAQLLLVAGRPLGEPVVQRGPFVMNSEEEIVEAIEDFKAGRLVVS